jgi:hypothetical protein
MTDNVEQVIASFSEVALLDCCIETLEEELKLAIVILEQYGVDWEQAKALYLGNGILSEGEEIE